MDIVNPDLCSDPNSFTTPHGRLIACTVDSEGGVCPYMPYVTDVPLDRYGSGKYVVHKGPYLIFCLTKGYFSNSAIALEIKLSQLKKLQR